MSWRVPLFDLDYDSGETEAVQRVLVSRWLTMGALTKEFEERFSSLLGARHAIAVSNATAALHLACLAHNIGPGDEVIVPSATFVATANAVLYTGADVRFADIISIDEPTICPNEIRRLITPKTKAIIVMHYGGYPCRMAEIMEIANAHGIAVIEDVAHAPGATLEGKCLGRWGAAGCFSFFSNKNLSTGEGGMFITESDSLAEKARSMRSHGMTTLTWDRHNGHAYSYDVINLGYNYRMDEMHAALGLVQLQKLPENNRRREAITEQYRNALTGLVDIPFNASAGDSAFHIFPIVLPEEIERRLFIDSMRTAKIQTSIHYPPIHQFSYYRKRFPKITLPKTESFCRREVTLPLYPTMDDDDVNSVVAAVTDALQALSIRLPSHKVHV